MDLLEYQAKALFREVGIPVLPSQLIDDPREIKQLQVPYPVVLKSQVRTGGRGKAGGIRFVENTIDAIAAAQTILHLPIAGEYPQLLLAEARYQAQTELFLAVTFDYRLQRLVLLGSKRGGMDVEALLSGMQKVVVEDDFSSFYARRLAVKIGLQGKQVSPVSDIVEKMYGLAILKDLDSIEINPLAIAENGEIMALDGKVTVNDRAAIYHPDLFDLAQLRENGDNRSTIATRRPLTWQNPQGNIGILCDGEGVAATIWDLLCQQKQQPRNCQIIGAKTYGKFFSESHLEDELERGLEALLAAPETEYIFLDILWEENRMKIIEAAIASVLDFSPRPISKPGGDDRNERPTAAQSRQQRRSPRPQQSLKSYKTPPKIVVYLRGGDSEAMNSQPKQLPIQWTNNAEEALLLMKNE
ncbi:ATP-grasp domain-containing protein [Spirulina sp. 06S082]|uniref:ATP-grasp domain-containing protein n=1 Tax=Spirulina sp. 06S082 TaxID=3110248 RepID=UPI002B1F3AD5|nr:ATP-grasp domain-containing protein [Spirulina sp. 06S082]MEA5469008.1 ATP-grasp domain-containing protein [Spirulina sp. 06S082]